MCEPEKKLGNNLFELFAQLRVLIVDQTADTKEFYQYKSTAAETNFNKTLFQNWFVIKLACPKAIKINLKIV